MNIAYEYIIVVFIIVEISNVDVLAADWKIRPNDVNDISTMAGDHQENMTMEKLSRLLVPLNSKLINPKKKVFMTMIPESFDVREKFGKLCPEIKNVYNQGRCKSGWAITIASVISDRLCIKSGGKIKTMLSAQNLLNCCVECCGCNGGMILAAWQWVTSNGIVSGSVYKNKKGCMPYKIPPAHPKKYMSPGFGGDWATDNLAIPECSDKCDDGSEREPTKIIGYKLWSPDKHLYIMEQLIKYGPLQVSMHIYTDFRYYKEGIYIHKMGKFESEHAVKLIGWGTWERVQYWLVMNSFGNTSWGMNGTFMIPRNGKDNTQFGYAIISPIFEENKASGINLLVLKILIVFFNNNIFFR